MIINGYVTKKIPCIGEYYASACGKIFNGRTGRQLKPGVCSDGHYMFVACEDGTRKTTPVHRAVFQAWKGLIPADRVIDHDDRDKLNNNLSNLRLATFAQNLQNNNAVGVYLTKQGTYTAFIMVNRQSYNKTFKTMAEAQAWRANMKAQLCPHTVV